MLRERVNKLFGSFPNKHSVRLPIIKFRIEGGDINIICFYSILSMS